MVVALILDPEVDLPSPKRGRWEDESIDFMGKDMEGTVHPYKDALVMTLRIGGFDVRRVMID